MNTNKQNHGRFGELVTAEYLREQGYIIVKKNYRDRFGEIDIIAENRDTLVFVEVKTRSEDAWFSGREAVDFYKQKRIVMTANAFAQRIHLDLPFRFDVSEVTLFRDNEGKLSYRIHYIPSAF